MTQKKGYRKKRYLFLIVIAVIWLLTRMEWVKFRYHPDTFKQDLIDKGQTDLSFHTIQSGEKTIHYLQVGKKRNVPNFVFIHGSPGALSAYEPYLADTTLSNIANLISVDRSGFGYSDFGETVSSLAEQAKMLAEVLQNTSSGKKILVGHSLACPIMVKLAMDYPGLVDGLLMVAPPVSPELEPSNTWRKMLDFPLLRWFTPAALRVCNQEIIPLKKELTAIEDDWHKIRVPVTVIQGEADFIVPKGNAHFVESKLSGYSNTKIKILENKDHFILWSEVPLISRELEKLYQLVNTQDQQ